MGAAVLVVIVVLVLTNLANHYWFSRQYLFTCPMVAVLLVSVGRLAGLSWTELGMGRHALLHGVVGLQAKPRAWRGESFRLWRLARKRSGRRCTRG